MPWRALEKEGWQVSEAENGRVALDRESLLAQLRGQVTAAGRGS